MVGERVQFPLGALPREPELGWEGEIEEVPKVALATYG